MSCECKIEVCLIDATECGGSWHTTIRIGSLGDKLLIPAESRLVHFKRCFECKNEIDSLALVAQLRDDNRELKNLVESLQQGAATDKEVFKELRAENERQSGVISNLESLLGDDALIGLQHVQALTAERDALKGHADRLSEALKRQPEPCGCAECRNQYLTPKYEALGNYEKERA